MKKVFLLFLLFAAFQGKAQSIVKGYVRLQDSTINRSVNFEVPRGTDKLQCSLKGFLFDGTLNLELVSPEGNSEAGFGLSTSDTDKKTNTPSAMGEASKTIKSPMPGTWKLTIKSRNSNGEFTYKITKT